MSSTQAFLADVVIVTILFVGIVAYVKRHLQALLVELCGTMERASFWLAFSNVALVLVPLIFALDYKPEIGPDRNVIFEMATQIKYALIGFVSTLGGLALVLYRFIPRENIKPANPPRLG
jgi:hypothetical protein